MSKDRPNFVRKACLVLALIFAPFVGFVPNANWAQMGGASVQFESATATVGENGGAVWLKVTRTGSTSGTSSVNFSAFAGTASKDTDYEHKASGVTFLTGETEQWIEVKIKQDTGAETDESFTVTLTGGVNCTVGSPSGPTH